MSDRLQDSQKTIASVVENLTSIMIVARAGGSLFFELVNAIVAKKPTYVPAKYKVAPKKNPSLRPVHQSNPAEEMAVLLMPLISERFVLLNSVTKKPRTQLGIYIKATGIVNKLLPRQVGGHLLDW